MPRDRKIFFHSDISVKDYADADKAKPNGRMRKKFGKNIDHCEHDLAIEIEEDELDESLTKSTKKLKKVKISNIETEDDNDSNSLPNDIWFHISEYIRPEDVTRFALICRQTYSITTTLKFWRNLYRRYYKMNVALPVRLQMDCMSRPRGIRACAIRSLFFTYSPFVNRQSQCRKDFHSLLKHRVVHSWYEQTSVDKYHYFYKLKQRSQPGSRTYESEQLQRKTQKSIATLRDVYCNTEEGCSLLVIESTKFHPLLRLEMLEHNSNIILSSITNHLSRSCSHYRLEMHFSSISGTKLGSVIYEPSISIQVYDWWVPQYSKYVKQGSQPSIEYIKDVIDPIDDIINNQNGTDDDAWDFVLNNT